MSIITRTPPPKQTPWGSWDHAEEHAPGIVFVSTPSHGGFHLDEERRKEAWERFGRLPTFTGAKAWLEEDCDAALVYIIWPEYATDEQLDGALKTVQFMTSSDSEKQAGWVQVKRWIQRAGREDVRKRARSHREKVALLWEQGSMSSSGNGWRVSFKRGDSGKDEDWRVVNMPGYPRKRYYTTEELDEIEAAQKEGAES